MNAGSSGAPRPAPAAAVLLAGVALLAGCATAPVAGPVAVGGPDRAKVYTEAVVAARQAAASGQLREALWRWRIAEAVAPDRPAATREAEAAQARLFAAADAAEAQGERAAKAGRVAEARAAYMRTLELDPERPQARAFMRAVLAEQVMSDINRQAGPSPEHRDATRDKVKGKRGRSRRRGGVAGP